MRKKAIKSRKGRIFVISGPSGSGKTTILKKLLEETRLRKKIAKSISYTTRLKRTGERHGRDYFFVSKPQFLRLKKQKKILEWTKYLGYYYATPKDFVTEQLEKGKNLLFCLDLKGALRIKRLYPENALTIFVTVPSVGLLKGRIEGRCSRTKKEEIHKRLKLAKSELASSSKFDRRILNEDLQEAVRKLRKIILSKLKD